MEKDADDSGPILRELDDNAWTQATNALVEIAWETERAAGRKPTCEEYCAILAAALQSSHRDLFCDVSSASIRGLKPVLAKVARKIKPGTLIGVPSGSGDLFPVLYLASNSFGDAFGVFKNALPQGREEWKPEPLGRPVYSSLRPVREGRWRILGARPDLVTLFPAEPEIYHRKCGRNVEDPRIGPSGSAEAPTGALRSVSREEAEEVGLLSGEYRQALLEDQFVAYLRRECLSNWSA